MTELGGRAALVTGVSRGIVRRLASEGASVACLSAASSTAGESSQRGRWATSTSIPGSGGYSVVTAEDLDGAAALAEGCPALRVGGTSPGRTLPVAALASALTPR